MSPSSPEGPVSSSQVSARVLRTCCAYPLHWAVANWSSGLQRFLSGICLAYHPPFICLASLSGFLCPVLPMCGVKLFLFFRAFRSIHFLSRVIAVCFLPLGAFEILRPASDVVLYGPSFHVYGKRKGSFCGHFTLHVERCRFCAQVLEASRHGVLSDRSSLLMCRCQSPSAKVTPVVAHMILQMKGAERRARPSWFPDPLNQILKVRCSSVPCTLM